MFETLSRLPFLPARRFTAEDKEVWGMPLGRPTTRFGVIAERNTRGLLVPTGCATSLLLRSRTGTRRVFDGSHLCLEAAEPLLPPWPLTLFITLFMALSSRFLLTVGAGSTESTR